MLKRVQAATALTCIFAQLIGQAAEAPPTPESEFMVRAWSMADGLPHPSVTALLQARDGYLWVGTLAGLVRFDGVQFKVFTPQNCPELPRSRIGRLFEGVDGTLFITTERGGGLVAFHDGKFRRLLGAGNEQDEIIATLSEASGHSLFVARSGALWRWEDGRFSAVSTNRDFYPVSPSHVCEDGNGRLWMVSGTDESSRLIRFDGGKSQPVALPEKLAGSYIKAIAKDADGQVWLGTSKGLAVLQGDRFEPVELPEVEPNFSVTDLVPSADGSLWVCGTNHWQRKYKAGRWVGAASQVPGVQTSLGPLGEDRWGNLCFGLFPEGFVTVSPEGRIRKIETEDGLPGTTVSCYLADHEGNEWLGLVDGGLVRLQARRVTMLGESILRTRVYSICEDHNVSIWVGTSFAGIYQFRGTNVTRYGPGDLPLTEVCSIFEDSHSNLWVGTSSHGVFQFRDGQFVSVFDQSRIADRVNAIYEDRQGRVWFGLWGGLACYADGQLTRVAMPWLSDDYEVVAITSDERNRIWLGTKGAGLFCLEDGKFRSYNTSNGLPSNLAWSLYVDRDDMLWVGTADGGLSCLRDGKFVNFTPGDGLADTTVCHIFEDVFGRFWFSSPHGIFSVRRGVLEAFIRGESKTISCMVYNQSDGMLLAACTCSFQPSMCATRDGRLLFPTLKGVAVLRPDEVTTNPLPPPIFIEEVAIGETLHEASKSATLTIPPGRSRLEIRYTGLNFSAPETVRFRYQLVGLDSTWVDGGTKRSVNYSYLPPGRYRFELQACNNDSSWSQRSASLELVILPHFWQTWWFFGTSLLGGAACIAFAVRTLEKAKSKRRLEREKQARLVELERVRIARDFHDDIGSDLTHVIVLSELLKGDNTKPQEVEANAMMIGNTARKVVGGLRTIIWAANPKNDTLDGLVQYISQYAHEFCDAASLPCRLDLPSEVPPLPLIAEVRHNLFMVIKEALHNAVKHAHASEVRLSLRLGEGYLELCVKDNGCGFRVDSVAARYRSGLANMRHRMEAIGATLFIESTPGTGTSIRVRWKHPREWRVGAVQKSSKSS